jgi:O-antigen/teichoic acid export membrane protein
MSLIPGFVLRRIAHRPNLVKIVDNIGWLFFDKVLRMGVGLIVGVWIARYLGPEQFGLLSFVTAFVGLFGAIAGLGLQGIVVRDIVRDPSRKEETLGTAAFLQFVGGLIAYGLILSTIFWLRPDDTLAKALVAILGSMTLFKVSEVVVYWFEAQVLSKYSVWVQNGSFLVFAAIKVGLLLNNAPLITFVWAMLAEALVVALLLGVILGLRGPRLHHLRITLERAKSLVKDSWPLLLSGIAVVIYMKIDQIMLGQMVDDETVGIYSAAVRISEAWYFILVAIVSSVFPRLTEYHRTDKTAYDLSILKIFRLLNIITIAFGVFIYFFSELIITVLFGLEYRDSVDVLKILGWVGFFVGIGLLRSKYLILEGLQVYQTILLVAGALVNVLLNYLWIPIYKEEGAAWATFAAYFFIVFIGPLVFSKLHHLRSIIYKSIISRPEGSIYE